ncbi:MAG: hypothetical protein HYZ37_17250 [Candidatus Solibacter usitatus]|nr:hypothetical protein [Candidatus Solibacter usitatus]
MVASALFAADPPAGLLRKVLEVESQSEAERAHFAYRQRVRIEDMEPGGRKLGEYRETRDVVFSADGKRHEEPVGRPFHALMRLVLTPEDFRDIREVQPFLFTRDQLSLYQTQSRGEETIDGIPCWVLQVVPRQILDGQRLFEGLIWVHQTENAVIRLQGRAVPQIVNSKRENLFPRFTTTRAQVEGKYWFPQSTLADDVLEFRTGAIRMRMNIQYENYKRFTADSRITYDVK